MARESAERFTLPSQTPVLIYLHIPRTGGTTLSRALRSQFDPDEVLFAYLEGGETLAEQTPLFDGLSYEKRKQLRLWLAGHAEYGQHKALPMPATYISLVREPVGRLLSTYRFLHDHPGDPLHHDVVGRGMSLTEFVQSDLASSINNWQVRCLAGIPRSLPSWEPDDVLARAKANIERDFAIVGTIERFPETIVMLGRIFGWRRLHYATLNVSSATAKCTEEDRRVIQEENYLDQQLYEFVDDQLTRKITSFYNLEQDLYRLSRDNRIYGSFYSTYRKAKEIMTRLSRT
jgi:hypothetical protein